MSPVLRPRAAPASPTVVRVGITSSTAVPKDSMVLEMPTRSSYRKGVVLAVFSTSARK